MVIMWQGDARSWHRQTLAYQQMYSYVSIVFSQFDMEAFETQKCDRKGLKIRILGVG